MIKFTSFAALAMTAEAMRLEQSHMKQKIAAA